MSLPKTSELYEDPLRRPSTGYSTPHVRGIRVTHGRNIIIPSEESHIEWSNLIFLPFHPVFRMVVVAVVFIKAMMVSLHFIVLLHLSRFAPIISIIT